MALLGDNAFTLMPWIVKPSRSRRVVENAFEILLSRLRVLLGTMEQRPRVVSDIVYACVVLHNMMRTHQGGADRAPNPGNDGAALQNNQAVCMPELQESFEGGQTSHENY